MKRQDIWPKELRNLCCQADDDKETTSTDDGGGDSGRDWFEETGGC